MNGLDEKTRHATQSEIDDLLAELGYKASPSPRRGMPAKEPESQKNAEPAAPQSKAPPREAPKPAEKAPAVQRRTAKPAEKPEAVPKKKTQSTASVPKKPKPVVQLPAAADAEEPLLDIPIDIPRRAPRQKQPVPEGRLLRKLREALDENVEEIEVLTAIPTTDETLSLTFGQRARKMLYFLLGLLFAIAALWGLVSIGKAAVAGIRDFASNTSQQEEFITLLEPLVLMDIQMFEAPQTLASDQILSAAIWDMIMHDKLNKYDVSMGVATVPAVDVEHSAAKLFGPELQFEHKTLGTADLQFYYDAELNSYHVPTSPSFFSYYPEIVSIHQDGTTYSLTVNYTAEAPDWQQQAEGLESEKTVLFIIEEQNGNFYIRSAENITAGTNAQGGT